MIKDKVRLEKDGLGISIYRGMFGDEVNIHNDCENITISTSELIVLLDLMKEAVTFLLNDK